MMCFNEIFILSKIISLFFLEINKKSLGDPTQ